MMSEEQVTGEQAAADPGTWFGGAARVMFVHAHPDDETITTGGTLAALAAAGREPLLVTLTRGERGEVVPGPLEALVAAHGMAVARQNELRTALGMLGVERHAFLGVDPARAEGLPPTIYEDSGMEWQADGRAGAAPDSSPDALTRVPAVESLNDLLAAAYAAGAGAVVSYDDGGGYGHPDHVHAHRLARAVATALGLPFWEIVADPSDSSGPSDPPGHSDASEPGDAIEAYDVSPWFDRKLAALRAYATQLSVDDSDPDSPAIVHVGGQRQALPRVESYRRVGAAQNDA